MTTAITLTPIYCGCKIHVEALSIQHLWYLIGRVIGDFGTILALRFWAPETPNLLVMSLAIINSLLTSTLLEILLLTHSMSVKIALAITKKGKEKLNHFNMPWLKTDT